MSYHEKYLKYKLKYLSITGGHRKDPLEDKYININKLKPLLYMYLDGYLSETLGSYLDPNLKFLYNYFLSIGKRDVIDYFTSAFIMFKLAFNIHFAFDTFNTTLNAQNKVKRKIDLNIIDINSLRSSIDKIIKEKIEGNKCIIIPITVPIHQIVIYCNKTQLIVINSGKGNERHKYIDNEDNELINLWYTIDVYHYENMLEYITLLIICETIIEKIRKNYNLFAEDITFHISENNNNYYSLYDSLATTMNNMISNYFNEDKRYNIIYDFIYKEIQSHADQYIKNNNLKVNNYSVFRSINNNKDTFEIDLNRTITKLKNDGRDDRVPFFDIIQIKIKDNELYTNPQRSGSCAWFSAFWALFLFLDNHGVNFTVIDLFNTIEKYLRDEKNRIFNKQSYLINRNQQDIYHTIDLLKLFKIKVSTKSYHETMGKYVTLPNIMYSSTQLLNGKFEIILNKENIYNIYRTYCINILKSNYNNIITHFFENHKLKNKVKYRLYIIEDYLKENIVSLETLFKIHYFISHRIKSRPRYKFTDLLNSVDEGLYGATEVNLDTETHYSLKKKKVFTYLDILNTLHSKYNLFIKNHWNIRAPPVEDTYSSYSYYDEIIKSIYNDENALEFLSNDGKNQLRLSIIKNAAMKIKYSMNTQDRKIDAKYNILALFLFSKKYHIEKIRYLNSLDNQTILIKPNKDTYYNSTILPIVNYILETPVYNENTQERFNDFYKSYAEYFYFSHPKYVINNNGDLQFNNKGHVITCKYDPNLTFKIGIMSRLDKSTKFWSTTLSNQIRKYIGIYTIETKNNGVIFDDHRMIFDISLNTSETHIIMKLNQYNVIVNDIYKNGLNYNKYPFLLFVPLRCNFFVLENQSKYFLLLMAPESKFTIFKEQSILSMILLLEISSNFIIPKFDSLDQVELLKSFYSHYGCNADVFYNFRFTENELDQSSRLQNFNIYTDQGTGFKPYSYLEQDYTYPSINNLSQILSSKNIKYTYTLDDELKSKIDFFQKFNTHNETVVEETKKDLYLINAVDDFETFETIYPCCKFDFDFEQYDVFKNCIKNNQCTNFGTIRSFIFSYIDRNLKIDTIDDIFKMRQKLNEWNNNFNLEIMKQYIIKVRNQVCKKLNDIKYHDQYIGFLAWMLEPHTLQLMQLNTIYRECTLLQDMLKTKNSYNICSSFSFLHQKIEINEDVHKRLSETGNFNLYMFYQQWFGHIINTNQWNKFLEIVNTYTDKTNKIFQFAMGKGKSSVILPLLCLHFATITQVNRIFIIAPAHLLKQLSSMNVLFDILSIDKIHIISDVDAKMKILSRTDKFNENDIMIFDEIDYMYDPIKSNLNKVVDSASSEQAFSEDDFIFVFDFIQNKNQNVSTRHERFLPIIENTLRTNIKNITYGMSEKDNKRHVIPFERQDTPLEGSHFSSILITLVLTIMYFKENDFNLEYKDLSALFLYSENIEDYDFNVAHSANDIIVVNDMINQQQEFSSEKKKNNFKLYFKQHILKHLIINTRIDNCSFIDVMNFPCLWKTGFSGTVNMDINALANIDKNGFTKIIPDKDTLIGVYLAINGKYPSTIVQNEFFNVNIETNAPECIWEHLESTANSDNPYNALIDIEGILKDFKSITVIDIIKKIPKYHNHYFIYIKSDNTVWCQYDNKDMKFTDMPTNKPIFIFFSQKHIIGIDIKNQPNNMKGLVIVNENSSFTDVAQGMFRLRKLNKGQYVDFLNISNTSNNKKSFFSQLIDNDKKKLESKDLSLTQQIFKLKFRKNKTNNKYQQTDMKPLYLRNDLVNHEEILKNQLGLVNDTVYEEILYDKIKGRMKEIFETSIDTEVQTNKNINSQKTTNIQVNNNIICICEKKYTWNNPIFIPNFQNQKDMFDFDIDKLCIKLTDNIYLDISIFNMYNNNHYGVEDPTYIYILIKNKYILREMGSNFWLKYFYCYDLYGNLLNNYDYNDKLFVNELKIYNSNFSDLKQVLFHTVYQQIDFNNINDKSIFRFFKNLLTNNLSSIPQYNDELLHFMVIFLKITTTYKSTEDTKISKETFTKHFELICSKENDIMEHNNKMELRMKEMVLSNLNRNECIFPAIDKTDYKKYAKELSFQSYQRIKERIKGFEEYTTLEVEINRYSSRKDRLEYLLQNASKYLSD